MAAIKVGGITAVKCGFIDKSGNIIIKPQFVYVDFFK